MATRMINDFVECVEARLAAPDLEAASAIKAGELNGVRLFLVSLWSALAALVKRLLSRPPAPGADGGERR